jgi:hypothetical protein
MGTWLHGRLLTLYAVAGWEIDEVRRGERSHVRLGIRARQTEEPAAMSTHSASITCPNCGVGEETDLACQLVGSGFEGVVTNQVGCEVCGLFANFAEIRKTEGEMLTEAAVVERATAILLARSVGL